MRYEIIENDQVVNTIEADEAFMSEAYAPGSWRISADAGVTAPVSPAPRYVSVGAFFDRFGAQKWPILSSVDPVVKALVVDCSVRVKTGINLDAPDVAAGLQLLQSKGFDVTTAAVIDAVVKDGERP